MKTQILKKELNNSKNNISGLNYSIANINEFSKIFNYRHDFNSEDLEVLKENFPKIKFNNIPEAWILLVDKMIRKVGDKNINSVSQYFGFLSVKLKSNILENKYKLYLNYISSYERKIYLIDSDIHEKLELV